VVGGEGLVPGVFETCACVELAWLGLQTLCERHLLSYHQTAHRPKTLFNAAGSAPTTRATCFRPRASSATHGWWPRTAPRCRCRCVVGICVRVESVFCYAFAAMWTGLDRMSVETVIAWGGEKRAFKPTNHRTTDPTDSPNRHRSPAPTCPLATPMSCRSTTPPTLCSRASTT
jgi:hypothetical protein